MDLGDFCCSKLSAISEAFSHRKTPKTPDLHPGKLVFNVEGEKVFQSSMAAAVFSRLIMKHTMTVQSKTPVTARYFLFTNRFSFNSIKIEFRQSGYRVFRLLLLICFCLNSDRRGTMRTVKPSEHSILPSG